MRKRRLASRKKRKNINTILITVILVIVVFICSTGYAFFSQKLDLNGTAKLNTDNPYCDLNLFEGYNDFEVTYEYNRYSNNETITGSTNTTSSNVHVDATITIKNVGTKTVNAWRLFLKLPENSTMNNFWNAKKTHEENSTDGIIFVFEYPSDTFNNMISPGGEVSFYIMYETSSINVDIISQGAYGWDLSTETMPTAEEMAPCIFNTTGKDDEDNPSIENPTYAIIPSTFETNYDGWRSYGNATLNLNLATIGEVSSNVLSFIGSSGEGVKASLDLTNYNAGTYKFSAMVSHGNNESIPVKLYYSANGGSMIAVDTDNTILNQWVELNGDITIPENATSLELYIIYSSTSNGNSLLENPLYIDNVNLEKNNNSSGGEIENPDPIIPSEDDFEVSIASEHIYDYNNLNVYLTKLTLTNNTDTDISNWYVNVDIGENGNAIGCWNATCSAASGIIKITPAEWGNVVSANSSITIEFQFATSGSTPILIDYGLDS